MIDTAIIAARLLQYLGAAILLGLPLFLLRALPAAGQPLPVGLRRARPLMIAGAGVLALSSLMAILAQASLFAGSVTEALITGAIGDIIAYMDLGKAAVVRASAATAAFALLVLRPADRTTWLVAAVLGGVAAASLAWMGHGATTESPLRPLHLVSDVLHALAAATWLGALAGFLLLLGTAQSSAADGLLYRTLHGFAGAGSILVAVLLLTGLVNGWVLVGPENVTGLAATPYGRLLLMKLVLFAAMLGLAANNRWWLTPALKREPGAASLARLKRSIAVEAAAGLLVLFLVAWLGTLEPPASP